MGPAKATPEQIGRGDNLYPSGEPHLAPQGAPPVIWRHEKSISSRFFADFACHRGPASALG